MKVVTLMPARLRHKTVVVTLGAVGLLLGGAALARGLTALSGGEIQGCYHEQSGACASTQQSRSLPSRGDSETLTDALRAKSLVRWTALIAISAES
jgi:hypothetical protein